MSQIYTYNLKLNLESNYFNRFKLKKQFDARAAEIASEFFDNYQPCVEDCHALILHFKKLLEKRNKNNNFSVGWEINPKRNTGKATPVATPIHMWNDTEIVHIFIFEEKEQHLQKTLIQASVNVTNKEDLIEEGLH